jgi:hypothetical protein|tara:strand:- start:82 stop:444 length:363 start_codon:yes stop_codon:yes gene_type:complete
MTDEAIEAAILQLRSSALETLGLMKEMASRPLVEGEVSKLALYAAKLANMEGGFLTLQQYAPVLRKSMAAAAAPTPVEAEEVEEEDPPEETPSNVVTPAMSETMKRVAIAHGTFDDSDEE